MRLALLSVLALAPSAAFACAMYIPSEELKQAMAEVDQAAKPAQPAVQAPAAQVVPAAQAAPAEKPAVQAVPAEKPAMPTSAPPVIAEVSEPAS